MLGGNTTQQQLAAAMQAHQTQNLLAILQAQQFSGMNSGSLLPTPTGMNQRGKGPGRQFVDKNRRPFQPQKRRGPPQDQGQSFKRRKEDQGNRGPLIPPWKQGKQQYIKPQHQKQLKDTKPRKAEGEEDDVYEFMQDEEAKQIEDLESIEIPQELIDKIEELRKRTKIDRNIADQDVDKLSAFHFDGQNYKCELCKIVAHRYKSIKQHFMGKKHSLNVIEARQAGNDVDREIMDIMLHPENWLELNPSAKVILKRQTIGFMEAKRKEEEEFKIKHPENYVTYRMDTRKSATKIDGSVIIRHVCESVVSIKDFAGEKQLFGCEFIKAASGFDCRLCNKLLSNGANALEHIRTPQHIDAYQKYMEDHPGYHDNIVKRNKDIVGVLDQHDGSEVVLYEAHEEETENQQTIKNRYVQKDDPEFVRIEKSVPEWHPKDNEEEEEENKEDWEEEAREESEQLHQNEGASEECPEDEPLDEEVPAQGFDEEDVNGSASDGEVADQGLQQDEPIDVEPPEEGEITDELPQTREELYEPSQPTDDTEGDAAVDTEQEPATEPATEPAVVQKTLPPVKKPTPKNSPATMTAPSRPVAQSRQRGRGSQRGIRGSPRGRGGRQAQRGAKGSRGRQSPADEKFEVVDEVGAE
ncbi:uncharacterized protein LOC135683165 isoform X2 [Rhopilema esculentum]